VTFSHSQHFILKPKQNSPNLKVNIGLTWDILSHGEKYSDKTAQK